MRRLLFSWVGGADWNARDGKVKEPGPIARTLADKAWGALDEVHLLNNYLERKPAELKKWLADKTPASISCSNAALSSPTNFAEVYQAADQLVRGTQAENSSECELIFQCSPGTYVMSAVWIILSNTRHPATLIEASKEAGVVKINVPFEFSVDVLIERADQARREVSTGPRLDTPEFKNIIHDCRPMRRAVERALRVAPRSIRVLIEGESGTGKELFARFIHAQSSRRTRPLHTVNCGAIPENLLEVELFGSEIEDPLEGATKKNRGRFEQADHSTLFLDEVSELPMHLQVKLLRAIEDGEITRVGGTRPVKLHVRYLCGSNRPLNEEVAKGRFRADLFYRLAEDVISLPPLRERGDDISLITNYLMEALSDKLKLEKKDQGPWTLSAGARNVLKRYAFPGNVRELANILTRAIVHAESLEISRAEIQDALNIARVPEDAGKVLERRLDENFDLTALLDEITRHYIARAGEQTDKNRSKAAALLGFNHYQTLSKRMQKLGIKW